MKAGRIIMSMAVYVALIAATYGYGISDSYQAFGGRPGQAYRQTGSGAGGMYDHVEKQGFGRSYRSKG